MKKRNLLLGALTVVAVAAVSVGSTLALLKTTSNTKQNVFTAAAGLNGQLKEDAFDGYDYGADESGRNEISDPALGIVQAQKVVPGRAIPKNPQVKNASAQDGSGVNAWIAIRLEVKCDGKTGTEAMNLIKKFADIDFAETWDADEDGITFYYREKVAPGAETTELFTTVTIKSDDEISVSDIKNFEINPTAYLIQAEGKEGATDLVTAKTYFAETFGL